MKLNFLLLFLAFLLFSALDAEARGRSRGFRLFGFGSGSGSSSQADSGMPGSSAGFGTRGASSDDGASGRPRGLGLFFYGRKETLSFIAPSKRSMGAVGQLSVCRLDDRIMVLWVIPIWTIPKEYVLAPHRCGTDKYLSVTPEDLAAMRASGLIDVDLPTPAVLDLEAKIMNVLAVGVGLGFLAIIAIARAGQMSGRTVGHRSPEPTAREILAGRKGGAFPGNGGTNARADASPSSFHVQVSNFAPGLRLAFEVMARTALVGRDPMSEGLDAIQNVARVTLGMPLDVDYASRLIEMAASLPPPAALLRQVRDLGAGESQRLVRMALLVAAAERAPTAEARAFIEQLAAAAGVGRSELRDLYSQLEAA
ncbi:hypothetical protein [Frigidibacter sp. SD6-1]|uniref:hypothetical protein n=1 Tax=Frigidibacter sp. SD6-1 TaxID=3032581 RepID=UPI0024E04117|nr:hypothetical protein [Frigidibacter sp. SD6-1]